MNKNEFLSVYYIWVLWIFTQFTTPDEDGCTKNVFDPTKINVLKQNIAMEEVYSTIGK